MYKNLHSSHIAMRKLAFYLGVSLSDVFALPICDFEDYL